MVVLKVYVLSVKGMGTPSWEANLPVSFSSCLSSKGGNSLKEFALLRADFVL